MGWQGVSSKHHLNSWRCSWNGRRQPGKCVRVWSSTVRGPERDRCRRRVRRAQTCRTGDVMNVHSLSMRASGIRRTSSTSMTALRLWSTHPGSRPSISHSPTGWARGSSSRSTHIHTPTMSPVALTSPPATASLSSRPQLHAWRHRTIRSTMVAGSMSPTTSR